MTNPKTSTVVVTAAVLAFSALSVNTAWAVDLNASISVSIEAQSLEAALLELSRQGHMQLVIATGSLPAKRSEPLSGSMPLGMALERLLKGSGLSYKVVGDHTIAIIKSADSSSQSADPQASPNSFGDSSNGTAIAAGRLNRDAGSNGQTEGDQKMIHRGLMVRLAAFFGLCVSAAAANQACAQSAGAADAPGADAIASAGLEEIVVTAERRVADVQKTPISIAVVSGDELMRQGQTQLDQVMASVGAVRLLEGADGPTFYIRGIGTGVPSNVGDPEVNLNVDGIYQSEPEFSRAGLYDVSRVEVLRGPQGTLYGRNAVAGVVNIVTNDPSFTYEGGGSVGFGNYSLVQAQGFLNVPLSDTLALRAAVGSENHNGYLNNGADDADVQSARVKLLWKPNDQLRLVITADNTHEGGEGEGEIQVGPPPPGFPIATNALGNVFTSSQPWTSPDPGNAARHTNFWSVHAQLDWDLGFGVLTAIPAYRSFEHQCLNCWRSETDQNIFAAERQSTAEVRLASKPGSYITWLGGLYYLHANTPTEGQNLGPGADSFSDLSGNQVNQQGQTKYISESYAAFGQVTVPVTSALRLTGGARETEDKKSETAYVLGETGGVINSCSTTAPGPWPSYQSCLFDTSKSWRAFTYTAGLEADLTTASLVYAKVSSGYKAGGFFQGAAPDSYDPEHLISYEIGSKNRFLDDRLQINLDAFYYNYRDYQVNYISFINPASAGIFGIVTANAQGATIYGADLEARYRFTPADEFDAAVYPLHARFKSLVIGGIFGGDFSHYPLPFAPNFSANLGYQHSWGMGASGTLTARMETHIESSTWVTFQQTAGTHQPSYTNSNGYLTYDGASGKWSLTGYVKNLENTPVLVNAQGGPAMLEAADIAPPRTYGVQLSARF